MFTFHRRTNIATLAVLVLVTLSMRARGESGDTAADAVLGEVDLVTSTGGSTASLMGRTFGVAIDTNTRRLYLSDTGNHRVLSWPSSAAFHNGQAADMVIGQADFVSHSANRGGLPDANTLNGPSSLAVDVEGNLYVADTGNHRVLEYNNPALHGTTADIVFGQLDSFTSNTPNNGGISANTLNSPYGITVDPDGKVYIADYNNNRVLRYNSPLTTNRTADYVYGQGGDLTTNLVNNGGRSAQSLAGPVDVYLDSSGLLYVAEFNNHRVLVFPPGSSAATSVFGQPDFVSGTANNGGLSASSLFAPTGVAVDSRRNVYIADYSNNRVLEYDAPIGGNKVADRVFGQPDFTTNSSGCSATKLNVPSAVRLDTAGNMIVCDYLNLRAVRYDVPIADTIPPTMYTSFDHIDMTGEGVASPYPSTIKVSGVSGRVTKVTVSLRHMYHTYPDDVDILLVGPMGQAIVLMSDAGDGTGLVDTTIMFDDAAAINLPDAAPIVSGTYKPTNIGSGDPFSAVLAPDNLPATTLSIFNDLNPNGDWKLYIVDDLGFLNGELNGWGLNIYTTPVIGSGPTASPTFASVGEVINFSAAATDSDGETFSYTWDFGDGTNGSGTAPSHAFSAQGVYSVNLTVTDASGNTVFGSVQVTIVTAAVGSGVDTDGDGFSDEFETAFGSSTLDQNNTPLGTVSAQDATSILLPDVKLSIKLSFVKANSDSISLSGTLLVPENFTAAGKKVFVDIGGVMQAFILDAKGASPKANNTFKSAVRGGGATAKFAAKFGKATLSTMLADEGLTNANATNVTVHVPITVLFADQLFVKTQKLSYFAKLNGVGGTKQAK